MTTMRNYSQNNEQDVILKFFEGRTGRFLDIGAFDGVTFSNTRALLESGWGGVLVEPDPHNLIELIESVEPFADRVQVWAAAVGPPPTAMVKIVIDQTDGRAWASNIVAGNPGVYKPSPVRLMVALISIEQMLSRGPFQFINIDAEGMDWSILRDMPEWIPGCEMICIEPENAKVRVHFKAELAKRGFITYYETNENIIAIQST